MLPWFDCLLVRSFFLCVSSATLYFPLLCVDESTACWAGCIGMTIILGWLSCEESVCGMGELWDKSLIG